MKIMYKIDKIDRKIVDLLIEDGRMSASDISRRIEGVSERAVRYRIERMVGEKIIRIGVIPNPRALGYSIVADVFIEVETNSIQDVAQKLAQFENVSYVACSIGERDVSAQVIAHDASEVYAFVTEVIGKIPGVRKTTTSIVPLKLKDVYEWRIPASAVKE